MATERKGQETTEARKQETEQKRTNERGAINNAITSRLYVSHNRLTSQIARIAQSAQIALTSQRSHVGHDALPKKTQKSKHRAKQNAQTKKKTNAKRKRTNRASRPNHAKLNKTRESIKQNAALSLCRLKEK